MSSTAMRENSSDSSSPEQSVDRESQSDEVVSEEEDDVSKETQNASSFPSGKQMFLGEIYAPLLAEPVSALVSTSDTSNEKNLINYLTSVTSIENDRYGQNHKNYQQGAPRNGETLGQVPPLELVGHSIACAPNPYCDPYYSGMMAAYGQPFVHPQFLDMHHARMPLPLEMAQEPVYVNAKQYHAILRRRQSRAKAELEKKLIKDRKPYLHESRHQHAMRRVRGSGGRFAKKTEVDSVKNTTASDSSQSVNSTTGINRVHSESAESLDTRNDTQRGRLVNSLNTHTYLDNGDHYGGSLGQQWISISSNQASQRAVAMK